MQTDDVLKDQRVLKKSKKKIQFGFISIVLIKASNFDFFLGKNETSVRDISFNRLYVSIYF